MKNTYSTGFRLFALCLVAVISSAILINAQNSDAPTSKPLKALLVAGGCCHDYKGQHEALFKGIQARANIQVDVFWTDDKSVNPPLPLYDNLDWAKGYDVIIHDECAAGNKDLNVLQNILDAHKTIPAVHLHCAMHSFRGATDKWFKHLGLQSSGHGPQYPIDVKYVDPKHPILEGLEDWTTIKEELYNNVNVFDAKPIAMGTQKYERKGTAKEDMAIVAWVNEKQGARSFSTTLGHNTQTVADGRYLDLVTRGMLWSMDKLNDEYLGKAFTGKNKVTFFPKVEAPKPKPVTMGDAPKNATLVTMTASSEEKGKNNFAWKAVDGNKDSRWCAANASTPQWLQLEFQKPQKLFGIDVIWESTNNAYQHTVDYSMDGKSWTPLVDAKTNNKPGDTSAEFAAKDAKFVKINVTGSSAGGWASIREVNLKGKGIKKLWPKLEGAQAAAANKEAEKGNDPYAKEGNIPPKIVKLTPEEEKAILDNVKVPDGFNVSVFSDWRSANYPVYVAAAPNGDLYVSSDGNGSLGRDAHRGRVLRLRDTNNDGTADEVTEFVKDIDSPRGLIWDHDRLYLLHPPHISVFHDKDGDGVAEDSQILIENIAFGFADRPADHTTNGIDMGIDGWIYIAGGDFGFMNAKGTDGTELQHRGGGVIRFRPDGSGLELFATGTRNILGTPISPLLDIFARDNTNDGGGWDVRFHHFTGLEDHGYPRLYKNFADEHVQPLADYGGGSGCGSVYIHEPGFPAEWANAPFTCDWGTGALWHHSVQRKGATFEEVTAPKQFIKMTRPTDADVDGMSAVYQASWRGPATFKWAGPEAGYIVRVTPKGFTPEPLPDYENMSDAELVAALDSPSRIRTMAAQRTLLRRDVNDEMTKALQDFAGNSAKPIEARVAALFAISQRGFEKKLADKTLKKFSQFNRDPDLMAFAMRAFGDMAIGNFPTGLLNHGMGSKMAFEDPRSRAEAAIAAARLNAPASGSQISALLADDDETIRHVAFQALAKIGDYKSCLAILGSEPDGKYAAFALMRMHNPDLIDELISRFPSEENTNARQRIISILARLAQREAEWTGDSWGTRPDTRGPYYQPEAWAETDKILSTLKAALEIAKPNEAAFIIREMSRNRIQSNDSLNTILSLAKKNPKVVPDAVKQLATAESIPPEGIEILLKAVQSNGDEFGYDTIADAVSILAKTDAKEVVTTSLTALGKLQGNIARCEGDLKKTQEITDENKKKSEGKYAKQRITDARKRLEKASRGFLKAPKLENHHLAIETTAHKKPSSPEGFWANAALLELASRKGGSPESRELSQKALETGWQTPAQQVALIGAAGTTKNRTLDERILVALNSPNSDVKTAAKQAAKDLKLKARPEDKTPKISTLDPAKALTAVIKHKGDVSLGEAIFKRATCSACHTVSQDQPQKGPYLGNIFETYKRPELAEAILNPNKTIAQGFATNLIVLKDGKTQMMGFVTDEQADQVTVRDIASKEHTFKKADIKKREELPMSMMPPGLMMTSSVHEFASLLDYLEKLSEKKK